jgi:hypothetical protein
MLSRWAYEGLAVTQFRDNSLEKDYFELNVKKFKAQWRKDYWIPEMEQMNTTLLSHSATERQKESARKVLITEIGNELARWDNLPCEECITDLSSKNFTTSLQNSIHAFLEVLNRQYTDNFNQVNDEIEVLKNKNVGRYNETKLMATNESLIDLLSNRMEANKIQMYENHLVRKDNPVYYPSTEVNFLRAHFYAPTKRIFGSQIDTFTVNIGMLWFYTLLFHLLLYFDVLRWIFETATYYRERLTKKPTR